MSLAFPIFKRMRIVGPRPSTVAALARTLREALEDELAPASWAAVQRALAYGSMQLVEDLIVGTGDTLTAAWRERFLRATSGAYEAVLNRELAKARSGIRVELVDVSKAKKKKSPVDPTRNRFTGVPHSDEFIRRKAADLVVRVSRDQRQAIREQLLARYSKERRPETLVRDLKQTVGLDPRRMKALRNFEGELRASKAKNIPAQVERYRKELLQNRAETIARTESSAIENKARQEAWEIALDEGALPIDAEKEWISTGDACPVCRDLDGVRVGISDSFPGGFATPPAHPNCTCENVVRSFQ